jgi:hypothetical protein
VFQELQGGVIRPVKIVEYQKPAGSPVYSQLACDRLAYQSEQFRRGESRQRLGLPRRHAEGDGQ